MFEARSAQDIVAEGSSSTASRVDKVNTRSREVPASPAVGLLSRQRTNRRTKMVDVIRSRHLSELERTLRLAKLRCLSTSELVSKLPLLLESDDRDAVLFAMLERRMSHAHQRHLVEMLKNLAERGETRQPAHRAKLDSAIRQLIRTLPAVLAAPLARRFLDDRRKTRRLIAYSGLRVSGVTTRTARRLVERFRQTGDQHLLELVVRTPRVAAAVDPEYVLSVLAEEYWRARLMEALILYRSQVADSLASKYPREFVRGAARSADVKCLPLLRRLL
jgi:hypothetical protein